MRTFELVTAALIGYASAIKMNTAQTSVDTRDGNMGQTLTAEKFTLDNLDSVQDSINGWYDVTAKPFITKHREQVYSAALAEAEKDYGALLETCDEGTKCREDVEKAMRKKIINIWSQVLRDFNDSITSSISGTRILVDDAWKDLVQCGEDANCC